jgi:hypothetical protein
LACTQSAVQAAFPYGFSESVAETFAAGFHLPQAVYDWLGIKLARLPGGGAWVVVVVGDGRDVAYRTVDVMVYANGV